MTSQKIIRSYLSIVSVFTLSASVIWGINTLFLLDAGLNIFEVFLANAAFTVGNFIFEIPTGVIADSLGRRVSFILCVMTLCVTTIGYLMLAWMGAGVGLFMLFSVFMGLGFTFYSGAIEAWLVDGLKSTGYTQPLEKVFSLGSIVSSSAMLLGTVGGGFLGNIDLSYPYILRSALLLIAIFQGIFFMKEIGFEIQPLKLKDVNSKAIGIFKKSIKYGWKQPCIRLLMLGAIFQTGLLIWAFYAAQPYFLLLLGRNAIWVAGVIAALISLSIIVGNLLVKPLSNICGKRSVLLLFSGGVQVFSIIGVGLSDSFYIALVFLIIYTGALGVIQPIRQAFIHELIHSSERATIISFDSMFGNFGGIIGQTGLGYLAKQASYSIAYVVGGIGITLVLPLMGKLKKIGASVDELKNT